MTNEVISKENQRKQVRGELPCTFNIARTCKRKTTSKCAQYLAKINTV